MKLNSNTLLVALALTAGTLFELARAECDEEDACISTDNTCTGEEEECCEGLGCFGFNFYKTCQDPPLCLAEWHDCSQGMECCDNLVCADTGTGLFECQKKKIGTRTVELPTGELIDDPEPEVIPEKKNLETTEKLSDDVKIACVSGDPHIITFDGQKFNCQGHGEFVILKSLDTQREIQGRFMRVPDTTVSVTQAIVIQDEGDTKKVQVSRPMVDDGLSEIFGNDECQVQLFVDGEQMNLPKEETLEFGDELKIEIIDKGQTLKISYPVSGLEVTLKMGGGDRCVFNTCYYVPETDDTLVGLLGSPDGKVGNDWMDHLGQPLQPPYERNGEKPYKYCTNNWCMTNKEQSLFKYNQIGVDFDDFQRCDLPYDEKADEEIEEQLTPEIRSACPEDDTDCFLEEMEIGEGAGKRLTAVNAALKETCNNEGGECGTAKCCEGFKCKKDGLAGKYCVPKKGYVPPTCSARTLGYCDDETPCCEGMKCGPRKEGKKGKDKDKDGDDKGKKSGNGKDKNKDDGNDDEADEIDNAARNLKGQNEDKDRGDDDEADSEGDDVEQAKEKMKKGKDKSGKGVCRIIEEGSDGSCTRKNRECSAEVECCKGLACIGKEGKTRCKKVQTKNGNICLPKNQACGFDVKCCDDLKCSKDIAGNRICREKVKAKAWKECSLEGEDELPTCGEGMACVDTKDKKRKVCKPLPKCADQWQCCKYVKCCPGSVCKTRGEGEKERQRCEVDETSLAASGGEKDEKATAAKEAPVEPSGSGGTGGGITADGDASDWDLDADYLAPMYNAGNADQGFSGYQVAARAYSRLDCDGKTLCILVKAEEGIKIASSLSDSWIKDYNSGLPGNKYEDQGKSIHFVRDEDKNEDIGWEGCFNVPDLPALREKIEIHANYGKIGQGGVGNTASTGKKKKTPISFELCP